MVSVTGVVAPTGGVVILTVSGISGGPLVYSRSFGSGAYSVIGTVPNPRSSFDIFVDPGELLQGPLPTDQGTYNYMVTDSVSTAYASGLVPYTSLSVSPDFATVLVERSLEAGIDGLVLPPGYQRPKVLHEMPKTGTQAIPYILVNQITMQQSRTQIGQDVPTTLVGPGGIQNQTLAITANRTWRLEVFVRTSAEREYYRDAVLAIFASMLASTFQPLGWDMKHSFMVHADQLVGKDMNPGFYFADILYTIEGAYNVGLQASYGLIETIDTTIPGYPGSGTQTEGILVDTIQT